MSKERLKIRFSGEGITPRAISASELADVIASYESALLHTIHRDNPNLKDASIRISLTDIKEGSAEYYLEPNYQEEILVAANKINTAIKEGKANTLPYKTIESLSSLWKFTRIKNCIAELNGSTQVEPLEISADTEIKIDESFFYKGETTIYGELERVGGSKPRVRIKTDKDEVIYSDVLPSMAKVLATKLYETVALKGLATWRVEDYRVEAFKADDYVLIEEIPLTESIKELSDIIGKYWKDISSPNEYLNEIRYNE